jgi:hypothetical protein
MQQIKEKDSELVNVRLIINFITLGSIATFLPFVVHLQWLTGPIVNAVLILALFIVGYPASLVLCFIPSMMALAGGLLPSFLAPMVPFIMLSNVVFVSLINIFNSRAKNEIKGFMSGVIAGAGAKFLLLIISSQFITHYLIKSQLALKVAQLMSWPQLATALTGGLIALIALKWLRRL